MSQMVLKLWHSSNVVNQGKSNGRKSLVVLEHGSWVASSHIVLIFGIVATVAAATIETNGKGEVKYMAVHQAQICYILIFLPSFNAKKVFV